jgi:hypothetical protein
MRIWLFFIGIFLCSAFAKAQSIEDLLPVIEERDRTINDTLSREYDDRELEVEYLENDLREIYTGSDFVYLEIDDESENFLSGFFNGIFEFIRRVFGVDVSPFWAEFIKYLVIAIIAGFAIYFLIRLLGNETASAIVGRSSRNRSEVKIADTHIEQIDLDGLIKEQIASGNYRAAIRYMYLNCLKMLSATGKIDWNYQKTNADYYRELKDEKIKEQFREISYLYDHIWYGEFVLDEPRFNEAAKVFEPLNQTS